MANFVNVYEVTKPHMYNIKDQLEKLFRDCRYKCFISFKKWCCIYNTKNGNVTVKSDDRLFSHSFVRIVKGDVYKMLKFLLMFQI